MGRALLPRYAEKEIRRSIGSQIKCGPYLWSDMKKYYEAYEDRYKAVHEMGERWTADVNTPIVSEIIEEFGIGASDQMLEIGCGEGRDAGVLLARGFDLTATDVSAEAVEYCKKLYPEYAGSFKVLDCVKDAPDGEYDFIYAVAVLHMLVDDEDRSAFLRFVRDGLAENGIGLVLSMGDGISETQSDPSKAFTLQQRELNGKPVMLAGTSCRMVSFPHLIAELDSNGLRVVKYGITEIPKEFPEIMYAVVKRKE